MSVILEKPDDLSLWVKFEVKKKLNIESSNSRYLKIIGEPYKTPAQVGYFMMIKMKTKSKLSIED